MLNLWSSYNVNTADTTRSILEGRPAERIEALQKVLLIQQVGSEWVVSYGAGGILSHLAFMNEIFSIILTDLISAGISQVSIRATLHTLTHPYMTASPFIVQIPSAVIHFPFPSSPNTSLHPSPLLQWHSHLPLHKKKLTKLWRACSSTVAFSLLYYDMILLFPWMRWRIILISSLLLKAPLVSVTVLRQLGHTTAPW